jgi:glycosyltransferase involved in cell wall biosynthesis
LGKGPAEARLRAEIDRLGIRDRVTLPGYCKEPWKYFAEAKCFVLSSTQEAFGNVVVEAMAYGLPVVATACSGPREILRHGEFGPIVPIGDHLQLAQAIERLLDNPGDPAARRKRSEEFSCEVRVPVYEKLIDGILGEDKTESKLCYRRTSTAG